MADAKYEIITDKTTWNNKLNTFFPDFHLHYLYDYHDLMASNGDGDPVLFLYTENTNVFLHTFLKKRISNIGKAVIENQFDIRSVFGYTGPISNSTDEDFNASAYKTFSKWCYDANIIAELIRFNPILKNQIVLQNSDVEIVKLKPYTYLDLSLSEEILFKRISKRTQKYFKKAKREYDSYLQVSKDIDNLKEFFQLYKTHMEKIGTESYYFFSDTYYNKLADFVNNYGFLLFARIDGKIVAGIIQLFCNNTAYPHHAARDFNFKESSVIYKYILWRSIIKAKEENMKTCLLGGGVTNELNDPLLQFKMVFNPVVNHFFLGKKVHHQDAYQRICNQWESEYPKLKLKYSTYIDKYRFIS
jgi:hypothetical protein